MSPRRVEGVESYSNAIDATPSRRSRTSHTTTRPSTLTTRRANVAWAFAAADVHAPELLDAIAETALTQGERFNSQDLANLAQAFSNARRVSPKLFDFIAKTCLQRGLGAFLSLIHI